MPRLSVVKLGFNPHLIFTWESYIRQLDTSGAWKHSGMAGNASRKYASLAESYATCTKMLNF